MQIALEGAQRSIREHEKFIFVLIRMLNDRALPVARPDSVTKSGVEPGKTWLLTTAAETR